MVNHTYHSWIVRCLAPASTPAMSPLEVLVLHLVHHRERPKTLADICLVLNVENTHPANYATQKLADNGFVTQGHERKEKIIPITRAGAALCAPYGEVREALLVRAANRLGVDATEMSHFAGLLRTLSGSYDHAARAADAH